MGSQVFNLSAFTHFKCALHESTLLRAGLPGRSGVDVAGMETADALFVYDHSGDRRVGPAVHLLHLLPLLPMSRLRLLRAPQERRPAGEL